MNILHMTTHVNTGGISSYISEIGKALAERGHRVHVLSSGGELEGLLASRGLILHKLPIRTKSILSPKLYWNLPDLIGLIRKEKIDVIHAHTRVTQVMAAVTARWTKTPVVTTCHGFFDRRFGRKIFPAWGKRVIAITAIVAEELARTHKVPASKVRVIYNAIDVPAYRKKLLSRNPAEERQKLGIPENAFVVGNISRLVKDKGQDYLVRACGKLAKKMPSLILVIVGEGRERKPLEALIKKCGLSEKCLLVPSTTDVVGILSTFDVFVHPATHREGFGLSMLEAMVCKVPVIASNVWAINTIIRHKINGFLIEPKNADQIEKAILEVQSDPEFSGSIAENAFQMASQNYSMERMAQEVETVYEEVRRK